VQLRNVFPTSGLRPIIEQGVSLSLLYSIRYS
jgi:hypothetical protein